MPDNTAQLSNENKTPSLQQSLDDPFLGFNWKEAARVLLNAVGYMGAIETIDSLPTLKKSLRGTGFGLVHTPMVNNIMPIVDCQLGCLLQLENGSWVAALGGNYEDAMLLVASSKMAIPLAHINQNQIADAWILTEQIIDLQTVLPFLRRYKHYFKDLFLAAIVVNTFALTMPLFSSFVYDKILGNDILETLWALVIGMLIVAGIELCVRVIRIAIAERFAINSEVEIDNATFRNLLDTNVNQMPSLGLFLERYKQILSYRDFLSSGYILAIADLPFLLLFSLAITLVAGPIVFIPLVCGALMFLISVFFTPPVLDYERKSHAASEKRYRLLMDLLSSREGIIGASLRHKLIDQWRQASTTAVQSSSKARYWRGFGASVANGITTLSFVGVITGGVYMVENHSLTSGGLLAASMLNSRMMGLFGSVITLILRYREFRSALRELNKIVPTSVHTQSSKHYGRLQGNVRFDDVTCNLQQAEKPILQHITFSIPKGQIVGIAGAPGAGKTTLIRLLAGVLKPDDGKIFIDNILLPNLSQEDISLNIGFKPQDFCLLDGTLEENIRAGRPPLTAEERHEILVSSGLLHMFEDGAIRWDTDIGARGTNLSGGQKQLISLARAMLTRPPLLLLDEPSNGLDGPFETYLAQQLKNLRGQSTVIISTHSRSMLEICDHIIVVGQGKLLANGPREKILV